MELSPVCIEREEENRWVGRIFESKAEDGAVTYTFLLVAPLQFAKGHSVDSTTGAVDTVASEPYKDLEEARTMMRQALHQRAGTANS